MRMHGDFSELHDERMLPVKLSRAANMRHAHRAEVGQAMEVYDERGMSCWGRVVEHVASDVVLVRLWLDTWRLKPQRSTST